MRRSWKRTFGALALTVTLLVTLFGSTATAAASIAETKATTPRVMTRAQVQVLDLINRARASRGRRAIRTNGLMNKRAMNWADHLREIQRLDHRRPPFGVPAGWCAAAENVGRSGDGGTILATHRAFMNSSGHRDNILNARWTDVGVGVVRDRGGEWWIVHAFADFSC